MLVWTGELSILKNLCEANDYTICFVVRDKNSLVARTKVIFSKESHCLTDEK
jgi:hypothetical protein